MDERQERFGEFVVTCRDASELLDPAEETLDEVAVFVDMAIETSRIASVGARWNDRLAALGRDGLDEGVRIVALVGNDKLSRLIGDQRLCLFDVGHLSCRENHTQRIAQGIDCHMKFGGQSAS